MMGEILLLAYFIAGYWAVDKTIWRNKVIITTHKNYIFTKIAYGIFLGFILIPWAIISESMNK